MMEREVVTTIEKEKEQGCCFSFFFCVFIFFTVQSPFTWVLFVVCPLVVALVAGLIVMMVTTVRKLFLGEGEEKVQRGLEEVVSSWSDGNNSEDVVGLAVCVCL